MMAAMSRKCFNKTKTHFWACQFDLREMDASVIRWKTHKRRPIIHCYGSLAMNAFSSAGLGARLDE